MKNFIAGLLVGGMLLGTAWAADKLYSLEPFSENLTNEEVIVCIKAGGRGALLFDLTLNEASPFGYDTVRNGQACVKEAK